MEVKMGQTITTVKLPEKLVVGLRKEADAQYSNVSTVIRQAVDHYLKVKGSSEGKNSN